MEQGVLSRELQRMCSLVAGDASWCSRKGEQSVQKTGQQQNLELECQAETSENTSVCYRILFKKATHHDS